MKRDHMTDYHIGADLKTLDWQLKVTLLEQVETVIKFRFCVGMEGGGANGSFLACIFFLIYNEFTSELLFSDPQIKFHAHSKFMLYILL